MLKKGYFNWLVYICYAIVLLHNSTPHCHRQDTDSHSHNEEEHHEHHLFGWLDLLFDHHNESISGEEDVFEWLQGDNSTIIADLGDNGTDLDDLFLVAGTFFEIRFNCFYFPKNENLLKIPENIYFRRPRHCNSSSLRAPPVLV